MVANQTGFCQSRAEEDKTPKQLVTAWVETADALHEETGKKPPRAIKEDGATNIEGLMLSGEFRDDEED